MRRRFIFACAAALPFLSFPAMAEPSSAQKALAMRLFDDAKSLIQSGKFAEACPKLAESQRLDPQLGTLLNLGSCYESEGRTASAWAAFKDAVEIAAGRKDPREGTARKRLSALDDKVPKMSVSVAPGEPDGFEVRQDGEVVARVAWGLAAPVDPGKHTFTAKAMGRKAWSATVDVPSTGAVVQVAVPLLEVEPPAPLPMLPEPPAMPPAQPARVEPQEPPAPMRVAEPPAPAPARGSPTQMLGYVLGGAGVVGLGVGTVFALEAMSRNSESKSLGCIGNACPADAMQKRLDARSAGNTATVGFIAGGVLLVGGVTVIVLAPKSTASPGVTATFRPASGLSMTGRF
jgi:hypothetical protein